jgi:hypothetical protein
VVVVVVVVGRGVVRTDRLKTVSCYLTGYLHVDVTQFTVEKNKTE